MRRPLSLQSLQLDRHTKNLAARLSAIPLLEALPTARVEAAQREEARQVLWALKVSTEAGVLREQHRRNY